MAEASASGNFGRAVAVIAVVVGVIVAGSYVWDKVEWRNPPDDQTLNQAIRAAKVRAALGSMSTGKSVDLDKSLASTGQAQAAETPPATRTTPPAKAKGVARAPSATDCSGWPGTTYVAGKGCLKNNSPEYYAAVAAANPTLTSCANRAGTTFKVDIPRTDGGTDRLTVSCPTAVAAK